MNKKSILLSALLATSVLFAGSTVSAAAEHHEEAAHVHTIDSADSVDGGWMVTEGRLKLDKHAKGVFAKATDNLLGCDYEPVALLGTQVVAGTNDCFLARLTPVVPNATPHWALVYVYEDLQGNVTLTNVKDLPLGE